MAEALVDVTPIDERNRITTLFRYVLAIPHLVVSGVWGWFSSLLAVVQWFIVLFTGKRNSGIFEMQNAYVGYSARVNAYVQLLIDAYPPFGTDPGQTGVSYQLPYEEQADRLSNALRVFYIIPAAIIAFFISIAANVLIVISWFAIIITGRQPAGMFDFIKRWLTFSIRLTTYASLMTDSYPKFS